MFFFLFIFWILCALFIFIKVKLRAPRSSYYLKLAPYILYIYVKFYIKKKTIIRVQNLRFRNKTKTIYKIEQRRRRPTQRQFGGDLQTQQQQEEEEKQRQRHKHKRTLDGERIHVKALERKHTNIHAQWLFWAKNKKKNTKYKKERKDYKKNINSNTVYVLHI